MTTTPADTSDSGPLSAEERETLRIANQRLNKQILGAAKVATVNGWALAVFGGLSVMTGVFNLTGLVIGALLLAFAWNEFRGRSLLRKLDLEGPGVLARNQIALAGGVLVYCAWSFYQAWAGNELAQFEDALGVSAEEIARLAILVYAIVFLVTAVVLGFTARYHFVRERRLELYLGETPEWVVDIQRSMSPLG